jgi:hypothetical protein
MLKNYGAKAFLYIFVLLIQRKAQVNKIFLKLFAQWVYPIYSEENQQQQY